MQRHDRIEAYLTEVCRQIRWKKARVAVSEEMKNHIDDQIGAYIMDGLDESQAEERAVAEMGDPVEAGTLLDRVHRPKTDWYLMGLTVVMIVFGLVLQNIAIGNMFFYPFNSRFGSLPVLFFQYCGPAVVAAAVFLMVYFLDFSKVGWLPCALYVVLTCLMPIYPLAAGVTDFHVSYYLQYFYLPIPIAATIVVYSMRPKGIAGLLISLLLFTVPAVAAFLVGSTATCVIISVSGLAVLTAAVVKGWFKVKKWFGLPTVFAPAAAAILLFMRPIVYRIQSVLTMSDDPLHNFGMRFELSKVGFTGGAQAAIINGGALFTEKDIDYRYLPYTDDTNILQYLIHRFGWVIFVSVLALTILFSVRLVRNCIRQRSGFGFILSLAVAASLIAQAVVYIAGNLGFMLFTPLTLPFLTHGGIYLVLNAAMIGVLLSVYRLDGLAGNRLGVKSNASGRDSKIQLS